jgi:signal recognition particle subunit SRP19
MKRLVLWPSYFDSRLTRKEGRRVPKSLSVESPTIEELAEAAKTLDLNPEVEPDKAYPSTPWVKGRLYVSKLQSKQEIIKKVGGLLKERRAQS